jgi:hypothetical protein
MKIRIKWNLIAGMFFYGVDKKMTDQKWVKIVFISD